MICALVAVLFQSGSPAAVIRAVALVVVNAVNGQRVIVSVGKRPVTECREVVKPFLTDFDAASAILVVITFRGITAPGFHVVPDTIEARFMSSVLSGAFDG